MTPFDPLGTVSLACTATTGRVKRTVGEASTVIVTCPVGNADLIFVTFGDENVVATAATGIPCLPGSISVFTLQPGDTYCAGICPTSTGTAYFSAGRGI